MSYHYNPSLDPERKFGQLLSMGFESRDCRVALQRANGNLEQAVHYLLSQSASDTTGPHHQPRQRPQERPQQRPQHQPQNRQEQQWLQHSADRSHASYSYSSFPNSSPYSHVKRRPPIRMVQGPLSQYSIENGRSACTCIALAAANEVLKGIIATTTMAKQQQQQPYVTMETILSQDCLQTIIVQGVELYNNLLLVDPSMEHKSAEEVLVTGCFPDLQQHGVVQQGILSSSSSQQQRSSANSEPLGLYNLLRTSQDGRAEGAEWTCALITKPPETVLVVLPPLVAPRDTTSGTPLPFVLVDSHPRPQQFGAHQAYARFHTSLDDLVQESLNRIFPCTNLGPDIPPLMAAMYNQFDLYCFRRSKPQPRPPQSWQQPEPRPTELQQQPPRSSVVNAEGIEYHMPPPIRGEHIGPNQGPGGCRQTTENVGGEEGPERGRISVSRIREPHAQTPSRYDPLSQAKKVVDLQAGHTPVNRLVVQTEEDRRQTTETNQATKIIDGEEGPDGKGRFFVSRIRQPDAQAPSRYDPLSQGKGVVDLQAGNAPVNRQVVLTEEEYSRKPQNDCNTGPKISKEAIDSKERNTSHGQVATAESNRARIDAGKAATDRGLCGFRQENKEFEDAVHDDMKQKGVVSNQQAFRPEEESWTTFRTRRHSRKRQNGLKTAETDPNRNLLHQEHNPPCKRIENRISTTAEAEAMSIDMELVSGEQDAWEMVDVNGADPPRAASGTIGNQAQQDDDDPSL